MLILVAALGKKGQLGLNHQMAWHNPEDLKHFKDLTLHQKVVFGRVTYENLPKKLINRDIYIVSNQKNLNCPHVIQDFKSFCQEHENSSEVFYICGGQQIYEQALPYCQQLYLSLINYDGPADTYFPSFTLESYDVEVIPYETFTCYHCLRKE